MNIARLRQSKDYEVNTMLARRFAKQWERQMEETKEQSIERLKTIWKDADTILIGAGAGLSTSAGFTYTGERFQKYFVDFEEKYNFHDMYSGGFYPYGTLEEHWAFWSRYIWINRYMDIPGSVYKILHGLVKDKNYFVLTTNVDHCFQRAGFEKERLFYTQGDYGLFQCSGPCHQSTYENKEIVRKMVLAQGFTIGAEGTLILPEGGSPSMSVPEELVPHCPECGRPMTMNLRADDTFVEDEGWRRAAERYADFLRRHADGKMLLLELGVGFNTPGIIKYPFWKMAHQNPKAVYTCLNFGEAFAPSEIKDRSIYMDGDIGLVGC